MSRPHSAAVVIAGFLLADGFAATATGIAYRIPWLVFTGAALTVGSAAALGLFWKVPQAPDDGIEAIADATRERLPRRWTDEDWKELERELNR